MAEDVPRTPYGFIAQTLAEETAFLEMMSVPPTPEEVEATLALAQKTHAKISARPDYAMNIKLEIGVTKKKDGELTKLVTDVFYTSKPTDDKPAKRLHSKEWVSPIFRDNKFSLLEMFGNFEMDSDFCAKTIEDCKMWINAEQTIFDDLPEELSADLAKWFDDLFDFQWNTYFDFKEKLNAETPGGATAESLRAECLRDGGKQQKAQPAVRHKQTPGAKYMHLPMLFKVVSPEKLGEISKRFKTKDLTVSREKAIERVEFSFEDVLANKRFYGMEKADGTSGPEELIMQKFHKQCIEAISSSRKNAIACGFRYLPIVDRNNIELSAASRRAIQANAGANLFLCEYDTPVLIGETNVNIFPHTLIWLGRIEKKERQDEKRKIIM